MNTKIHQPNAVIDEKTAAVKLKLDFKNQSCFANQYSKGTSHKWPDIKKQTLNNWTPRKMLVLGINYQSLRAAARKIIKSNACSRCRRHSALAINFYSQRPIAHTKPKPLLKRPAKAQTRSLFSPVRRKIKQRRRSMLVSVPGDEIKKSHAAAHQCLHGYSSNVICTLQSFISRLWKIKRFVLLCWRGRDRWLSLQSFTRVSAVGLEAKTNIV